MATIVQEASGTGAGGATFAVTPTAGNHILAITSARDTGVMRIELGGTGTADTTFTVLHEASATGGYDDSMGVYIKPVDSSQKTFRSLAYRLSKSDRVYLFELASASTTASYTDSLVSAPGATLSFNPGDTPSVPSGEFVLMAITWDNGGGSGRTLTHTGWTLDLDSTALDMQQHIAHRFGAGAVMATAYSWNSTGYNMDGNRSVVIHLADAPASVVADFVGVPTTGAAPLAVQFTDQSTGSPDTWAWDFDDGGTSTSQNPSHTFTNPGSYDVTLVATRSGDASTDTVTKTSYVISVEQTAGVFVDWDGDGFATGANDDVSSDVISWTINRGSGAEITGGSQPGSATVVLKNSTAAGAASDDRYNPRNGSSPLSGKLRDGTPIWIGPNSDGKLAGSDARGLFGGRITDITLLPEGGAGVSPTVEITCEDALGWYARTPVVLDYEEGRAHDHLREEALVEAGETSYSLAHEIHTMPLSHADGSLLSVLDAINAVNGTRHWAHPENLYTDWYTYTTRNRQWRLDATSDASLSASSQHVTGTDGWRLAADTVINRQRATVTPIVFTPATFTVWQADTLPFGVTTASPYSRIVDFDDVVSGSSLDIASTGATITATYTPFASAGKIELSVASGTGTVTALSVEGSLARRLEQQSAQADDTTSQAAPRGIREGSEIGNEYLGVIASARGIAEHVVWRYGDPQLRPTLTVVNWLPTQFNLDLFDVISFTSTQLGMTAQLFEIVGLTHTAIVASSTIQYHTVTYVLQESKVQADPGWFILDSSLLDGADILAY